MRRNLLVILFLSLCALVSAQSDSKAAALFEKGQYEEAKQIYEKLLRKSPQSVLYSYRYARCAQETGDHRTALKYFGKTGKRYVLTYFFMGESYMALWQPEEAIEAYQTYLSKASGTDRAEHIEEQMRKAELRRRYLKRVRDIEVYDSVILPKRRFLEAYRLSGEAGTLELDTNGCVSYKNQRADRCIYSVPVDSGMKLASRYRLLDQWSAADTLGENVNFSAVQNYPFCQSDGVTICFASDSKDGFGGLDIYMSRYNSATNTYTKPENAGFPFNSEGNDYMLVTDESRHVGYFATDRFCSLDSVCVYRFRLTDEPEYVSTGNADTLAMFAQLRMFHRAAAESEALETAAVGEFNQDAEQTGGIHFVLNDSIVYVTEDDFVSKEAQDMYAGYLQQVAEVEPVERQLNGLRDEYRTADEEQRKQLVPSITKLEQKQKRLQKQLKDTLQQVRKIELSALIEN